MIQGKEYDQHEKLELSPPEEKTRRINDELDKNSLVEMIEERLKRFCTNEIDARKRLKLQEEKGVGGREKQLQLGRGNRRLALKRKATIEIIEERMQRFRTSRMDTRLQTLVPRRRRVGGWEKNKDNFGQGNYIG